MVSFLDCALCKKGALPADAVKLNLSRSVKNAHRRCVERSDEYALCRACDEAFPITKMKYGACLEHAHDFAPDTETDGDTEDYIEYVTKDGF